MTKSQQWRVFILFSAGYFISYLYRGVNLGFTPALIHDLGLSAADLGALTSLYFLGFAGAQIPVGMLLDHYGPRRVTAALLLLAAAGALVFGGAHNLAGLMAGRLMIGAGVSVCLAAAFKALAQTFELRHLPLLNGLVMAVGGFGGVVVGTPLTALLTFADWRTICVGIAIFTATVSLLLWWGAPEFQQHARQNSLVSQFKGTLGILRNGLFWKIASFPVVSQGVFYAMQSLWIGAWLRDVARLDAGGAAAQVSVIGIAMMAGSVGFGALARKLERRGLGLYGLCGVGMVLFLCVQLLALSQAFTGISPLPQTALWAAYGFSSGSGILSYAVLTERFPHTLIGRANTTLTLVMFLLIFIFQLGVGAVLSVWPAQDGHYPVQAHIWAWGVLIALQIASAIYYALPRREQAPLGSPEPARGSQS